MVTRGGVNENKESAYDAGKYMTLGIGLSVVGLQTLHVTVILRPNE